MLYEDGLCTKCQRNEAVIHFTAVVESEEETVHLCKDCAPPGLGSLDPKQIESLSIVGKKCEFCGKDAFSGEMRANGGGIFWCFDCGLEFGRIVTELLTSERPDLMQRKQEEISLLSMLGDREFQEWSETANPKAVQILKDRRRQDGRDPRS